MSIANISALIEAFAALLVAEEALLSAGIHAPARGVRAVIEDIRGRTQAAIEDAIVTPGDAVERSDVLRHAIDFGGAKSPLVAKAARVLADAIELSVSSTGT